MPSANCLVYRPGKPGDELCLSVLAMQVFLDTYAARGIRADLAREALNVYSAEVFASRLADLAVELTVVESDEYAVAFSDVCLASVCPVQGIVGPEVLRLYVQGPFQRQGIGQALLKQVEARARHAGASHVWLTAWIGNTGALAFYPAAGYKSVGTTQYVIEGQAYENRIYAKSLESAI